MCQLNFWQKKAFFVHLEVSGRDNTDTWTCSLIFEVSDTHPFKGTALTDFKKQGIFFVVKEITLVKDCLKSCLAEAHCYFMSWVMLFTLCWNTVAYNYVCNKLMGSSGKHTLYLHPGTILSLTKWTLMKMKKQLQSQSLVAQKTSIQAHACTGLNLYLPKWEW